MTLEELTKALGLDTDENKDKASILKKEYNAQQRELNKAKKDLEASNKSLEDNKASLEKLDIVKKAFNLDFEAEDIDTMIQEKKDEMLKGFGLSAGIAMSVSFVAVMLGLFFCEKKFVFAKSINSKPLKQALTYLFRCVVDFGFFKILDFTLNDMLNMSAMLVYIFSAILIFLF